MGASSLASIERSLTRVGQLPCALKVNNGGDAATIGEGEPRFEVFVRSDRGVKAIRSLHALEIVEAYMLGDLDIEGDFVAAMAFQELLSDEAPVIKTWRRLKPLLVGRRRCNPAWIAKHYDSNNAQLLATDNVYDTYTPGIYESEDDTLEKAAKRKLEFAFQSLQLEPGQTLLDIGCGWGGFMRYCAERGVRPTGISLSKHQLEHTRRRFREEELECEALYRDFFAYEPKVRFDAISMMGVMEDLSDYDRVMSRVVRWLKPGGRIYLDFATERTRFSTASFITKYIWPGTFRKVYLPELIDSVWASPFEIVGLYNDRLNYRLWGRKVHERWLERKSEALEQMTEEQWRMFRVLFAAAESIMGHSSHRASAQRMVLELQG
jgi:cyclopropane-fatty-acyl-phospholipid synthase